MSLLGVEIAILGAFLVSFGQESRKVSSLAPLALAKTCFIGVASELIVVGKSVLGGVVRDLGAGQNPPPTPKPIFES